MSRTVLLLSDKSCGSTILQKEILKHSAVKAVAYTEHNDHETLFWVKAAVAMGMPSTKFFGGRCPFNRFYARESIRQLVRKNLPGRELPNRFEREDIHSIWNDLVEQHGPVFFEKSPHHLNNEASVELILNYAKIHPEEVRIIGLVRNPVSVVYSTLNRWYVDPHTRQQKWLASYNNLQRVVQALPGNQCLVVRYEDVIADSEKMLNQILAHCGLQYEKGIGSDMHRRSLNKWDGDRTFGVGLQSDVRELAMYFGYNAEDLPISGSSAVQGSYQDNVMERWRFRIRSRLKKFSREYLVPALRKLVNP